MSAHPCDFSTQLQIQPPASMTWRTSTKTTFLGDEAAPTIPTSHVTSDTKSEVAPELSRNASVSGQSHAESSASSIKSSSSALHTTQSIQGYAFHARRASASSQVLLAQPSRSGTVTPLQSSVFLPTSRSSFGPDDSGELDVSVLEAIHWPQPPATPYRSPAPSFPAHTPQPARPYFLFLQSDPSVPAASHPGPPTPAVPQTSLSADGWSEATATGSNSSYSPEGFHSITDGLYGAQSNETVHTGLAFQTRGSPSSSAGNFGQSPSGKSNRSRNSSKRCSGSVSVKSAAGLGWEPYAFTFAEGSETDKFRNWEEVQKREGKLGLAALVGRARVMEKLLKEGKRVSNSEPMPRARLGFGYVHYPALATTRGPCPHRPSSLQSTWKSSFRGPSCATSDVQYSSANISASIKSGSSRRFSSKTDRDRTDEFTQLGDIENEVRELPVVRPGLVIHRHSTSPPPLPEKRRRNTYACCSDHPADKSPCYIEEKVFDLTQEATHLHTRKVRLDSVDRTRFVQDSGISQVGRWARSGKRWRLCAAAGVSVALILMTGLLAGLLSRRHNDLNQSTSPAVVSVGECGNGEAGVSCSNGSDCLSTPAGGTISKALVDLLPQLAALFGDSTTADELAELLVTLGVPPDQQDCSQQASIIDIGTTLVTAESHSSLEWAQCALLWQLVRSEDALSTTRLRNTIRSVVGVEPVVGNPGAAATVIKSRAKMRVINFDGWQFDLDARVMTPASVSWQNMSGANPFQISLVGKNIAALDRVASYAQASSKQRTTALSRYWTSALQQPLDDLGSFLDNIRGSPFLLSFNGSDSTNGTDLVNQLTDATLSFPPPTVCLPSLDPSKRIALQASELSAFGMNGTRCEERPIYGIINPLRLRAPVDASQALVLNEDTKARVAIHHGPSTRGDAREWGTADAMEHVVLSWLKAFPSTEMAREAITYISHVDSPLASPPSNLALLAADLPLLEIALFGRSLISTTNFTLSLLSCADSSLFFGSAQASRLRAWALQSTSGGPPTTSFSPAIVWAQNATSVERFIEQSTSDTAFDAIFNDAARLIQATEVAGDIAGPREEAIILAKLREGRSDFSG